MHPSREAALPPSTRPTAGRGDTELLACLDEQAAVVAELRAEIAELRALLGRGQRELLRRIDELHVAARPAAIGWAPAPPAAGVPSGPTFVVPGPDERAPEVAADRPPEPGGHEPAGPPAPLSAADYARLVTRVHALVRTLVPGDAVVAVASRGDDALIDLDGRLGWHFPRCDDGRYAGHYPKDSVAAVAHLEDLRRRGARFLVFPATALWWLDYYDGLRRHLEHRYRLVVRREDACVIFALDSQEVSR